MFRLTFNAIRPQSLIRLLAFAPRKRSLFAALAMAASVSITLGSATKCPAQQDDSVADKAEKKAEAVEPKFLSEVRQLTFEGRRAGEGYFSPSGDQMVFQSERLEENPFFQIYVLDFETGDVSPVSPGHGKTTCAWINPDEETVLFSSTHDDPEAVAKQKAEIEMRESGTQRRYSWDYDENYELYAGKPGSKEYVKLTDATGYDAEGSYSPDGKLIAFASNRNAYSKPMTEEQKKKFEVDPAYMMDLFIMNADGSNVQQLTEAPGYDGGPFFSPDGKRICWRRFSENGATAEIMTMNIDGSDKRTLTKMGALSWAPFYHPSGDYLIFTTNKHGFANFELYLVAADGKSPPVRVTDTEGFDGLASFSPDGKKLTWTSNRNAQKQSQIYLANWNDNHARKLLGLDPDSASIREAFEIGLRSAKESNAAFRDSDIARHVQYLCRNDLAGRMTGSKGERMATAYVAAYFDYLGIKPAGDDGTWFQTFEFPDGAEAGPGNVLSMKTGVGGSTALATDVDWRPLSFSGNTSVESADVVFAGYGIVAEKTDKFEAYDSYKGLDVKGKWAMVFRFVPEDVSPELRQHLSYRGELRKKLLYAREQGAAGMIVVSGPSSNVNNELIPLFNDFSPSGSSIAAISITDSVAQKLLGEQKLGSLQKSYDDGTKQAGFALENVSVAAQTDIKKIIGSGRNVVGRLIVGDAPSEKVIVVGAHIDHLGQGKTGGSLARENEKSQIHFGADDNASGIAGMLEIAEYISKLKKDGKTKLKHDIVFAGWSGEELGLHGSKHFAKRWPGLMEDAMDKTKPREKDSFHDFIIGVAKDGSLSLNDSATTLDELGKEIAVVVKLAPDFPVEILAHADVKVSEVEKVKKVLFDSGLKTVKVGVLNPAIDPTADRSVIAALNMDMIGRLEDKLVLQGIGSSDGWSRMIETSNAVIGLPLTLNSDTELPTDATSFYKVGVPILSAFTGSHKDYHTPRDTPEKLNYPEAARIAKLMGLVTRKLSIAETQLAWKRHEPKQKMAMRGGGRAYLGTVPDYGADVVGVKLDDVKSGGPAQQAGVRGGDVILELAGTKIENIYDYTAVIDRLKPGQKVKIRIQRGTETMELELTPGSRQ
ncbi:M28 family peptidase [Mariniblastus fucicola]|uniref:Translocation protein TolB n=1 Tax=Mariniblastus fucicola TaxID=980251 RepID=A0A5B9PC01_9BACT|nr:M28 family peptidase [Mariniblastus fucicola]QEG24257.1 translocation protein TolB [Mariniblastus fucicola]